MFRAVDTDRVNLVDGLVRGFVDYADCERDRLTIRRKLWVGDAFYVDEVVNGEGRLCLNSKHADGDDKGCQENAFHR